MSRTCLEKWDIIANNMAFNTNNQSTDEKPTNDWIWEIPSNTEINCNGSTVVFHPVYSEGTAVIKGSKPLEAGRHHYWEIMILSRLTGTDLMIGVGTANADFRYMTKRYCSALGKDRHSWGYSYRGYLQHDHKTQYYDATFNLNDVVGIYLDTWRGMLQFFLNKKPLGIAFTNLSNATLYPMVSCTMHKCIVSLKCTYSMRVSLQSSCLAVLTSKQKKYLEKRFPGLRYLSQSIFADILKKSIDEDNEDDIEFPVELGHVIIDDFDYALVGCRQKKRKLH